MKEAYENGHAGRQKDSLQKDVMPNNNIQAGDKSFGCRKATAGTLIRCLLVVLAFVTNVSLGGCSIFPDDKSGTVPMGKNPELSETQKPELGYTAPGIDSFDSADTAIVMEKNADDNTVTFWNRTVGRTYTLSYDGTTKFADKYGESISLGQVSPGDVVELRFMKGKKHLASLKLSSQTWSLEKVTSFEIDPVRGEATVGLDGKKLQITGNTKFFSDGKLIDMMELNSVDVVSFYGIDTEILTVRVEQGHGYLRLLGDEKFIGGWIEIGQSQIRPIREDMLLTLAEGSYHVTISKGSNAGEKTAVIRRNEETVLDISDIEVAEPEKGIVLFSLTPTSAVLYVDGEKVDPSAPVTMEYGLHQLIVKATGYQTVTRYLRVGQPSAGLDIVLDPVGNDKKTSDGDTSGEYYKVYIDAPEGAEVYLDGNYVGIVPCSFKKEAGSKVVTLRKSGYATKSYTLQIGEEKKDISYSFADLLRTDGDTVDSQETENPEADPGEQAQDDNL